MSNHQVKNSFPHIPMNLSTTNCKLGLISATSLTYITLHLTNLMLATVLHSLPSPSPKFSQSFILHKTALPPSLTQNRVICHSSPSHPSTLPPIPPPKRPKKRNLPPKNVSFKESPSKTIPLCIRNCGPLKYNSGY